MRAPETNKEDAEMLALSALGWILAEESRAQRLLSLTGLHPDDLRARIGDPAVLDAVLAFLESHQPDLIACATAIGVKPEALILARGVLAE